MSELKLSENKDKVGKALLSIGIIGGIAGLIWFVSDIVSDMRKGFKDAKKRSLDRYLWNKNLDIYPEGGSVTIH